MKHHANGQRRPEEIEADIERTRGELQQTLSAIEQRLSPGQLVDQGLEYLRSNGVREYASNLGTTAKQDPLPLALVGIGLAWLMMSSRRAHDPVAAAAAGGEHAGTAASVKDKLSSASQRMSQTAQAARERAHQVGDSARYQAQRLRGGYERMVEEQPLALGAIGLAIGAVLAASAPRTRTEERWVGGGESESESELADERQRSVKEVVEAEQAAQSAADGLRWGSSTDSERSGRAGDAVVLDDEVRPSVQPYAPYVPPVR